MIGHIDVSSVLRRRVCELYSDLVTRPTGAAVRAAIEQQLAESGGPLLTVIDFTNVGLLDFSCADEVVAKLLLRYCAEGACAGERYFLFRGVSETHVDAIEQVLERHGLALVAEAGAGPARLVGVVEEPERLAWETLRDDDPRRADRVAERLAISAGEAARLLDRLHRRRLCMRAENEYRPLGGRLP